MSVIRIRAANGGTETRARRVDVRLKDHEYAVHVGSGARRLLPAVLDELGVGRVAVVSSAREPELPDPGVPFTVVPALDGERHKTLASVETYCRAFVEAGLTRSDAVIACGGGTTTDTVGLAAALYHRGIKVVHLPTTLLAQVDASVGGKTAVNLPEGKNLVGAYWQPSAVLCDTDFLHTLPRRELLSGYGEIARCAFIGAGDLRGLDLTGQIVASITLKASVVARDERDQGPRHILNYGHTLGHAIERATDYAWRHGEAVAVGTVFAGLLAGRLGRIDAHRVSEHREMVESFGLPTWLPSGVPVTTLVELMRRDKKKGPDTDPTLTFVLDGPAGVELVPRVHEHMVSSVLADMPAGPAPASD
ncbi:3-dehydroquinate synthase family protein [Streptomyces bobili]|jgi:5-deoxy-5-amino-3-dehydroquinate synthase|uniref:3-dehydroquinate synthase family protein n=1 Tax=Streptomyces bobili TaxID=67280 RepID=UPI000A3C3AF0|nr:3-dehydroquinate synthase family protein [Streptomyces bobili]